MMRWIVLLLSLGCVAATGGQPKRGWKMGMTTLPYEISPEAVGKTLEFVKEHSDLAVFSLTDGGVPWTEALDDKPLPVHEAGWAAARSQFPETFKVYLKITPLNDEKNNLAGDVPPGFQGKPFDDRGIMTAYLNFCRRAVTAFKADYICIAVDASDLIQSTPERWAPFMRLCKFVRDGLKKENPSLQVGVSHSLPMLWNQQVARAVKPSLKDLDWLGLNFHPYISFLSEISGGRPLPTGKQQWLAPLQWARGFSAEIPLAICETSYSTRDLVMNVPGLERKLKGDPQVQKEFLSNVCDFADAGRYAFVIWTPAIDCDKLADALPPEMKGFIKLFKNGGLMDASLKPKPALEVWDRHLKRNPRPQ